MLHSIIFQVRFQSKLYQLTSQAKTKSSYFPSNGERFIPTRIGCRPYGIPFEKTAQPCLESDAENNVNAQKKTAETTFSTGPKINTQHA